MTMGPKIRLITTVTCPVCDFPAQEAMPRTMPEPLTRKLPKPPSKL